ncbi:cardiolipin synthase ClsB [Rhizobacter sp. J219]|jgi:cardiolipin synthase|uniref:cardiolipin synthase ClsB n=1 Tax=Rhizobacter sp. J219 TaxID=2898430 RepID=UPI0021507565|nr:cardiolipin synthase ClsB [Rhizobacter sp. J219]MCR5883484.1 cardiolipin synthase ClsB [Rhizobacter sp. J219]
MSTAADKRNAARAALMRVIHPTVYSGGNQARLLRGGDALFPAMVRAVEQARHEIWLATYIYDNVASVTALTQALVEAAQRGVHVKLVVDGFGSRATLLDLRSALCEAGVQLTIFRPLDRWWAWLQPSQLRRLHQKLCVVDGRVAFVGGINLLDDCYDQVHGWTDFPRLDFAVELSGPVVAPIEQAVKALWTRANVGRNFAKEMAALARSAEPVARARRLLRRLRMPKGAKAGEDVGDLPPVRAAFVMRDNLRQRRAIERSYIHAIRKAKTRVDLISPYFYPGRAFMRVLINAARRGVQVRLLLQGKVDYRIAAVAAQALYDQLLSNGVKVYEYTPAFLHAKVGLVDDEWATVGSSNIDPLSLLLNLEANVVIRDADFVNTLAAEFDNAVSASREIDPQQARRASLRGVLRRGFVAWVAHVYLRVAGITGRY